MTSRFGLLPIPGLIFAIIVWILFAPWSFNILQAAYLGEVCFVITFYLTGGLLGGVAWWLKPMLPRSDAGSCTER